MKTEGEIRQVLDDLIWAASRFPKGSLENSLIAAEILAMKWVLGMSADDAPGGLEELRRIRLIEEQEDRARLQ